MNTYLEAGNITVATLVISAIMTLPFVIWALRKSSRPETSRDKYQYFGLIAVAMASFYSAWSSSAALRGFEAELHRAENFLLCMAFAIISLGIALVACRFFRIAYYSAIVFLLPIFVVSGLALIESRLLAQVLMGPMILLCAVWFVIRWVKKHRVERRIEAT
jgi:hypothetical protein